MRPLHPRLALLLGAVALAGCVTITEEDPRRARPFHYPEPVPTSAWAGSVGASAVPSAARPYRPPEGDRRAGLVVYVEGEEGGADADAVLESFSSRGFGIVRVRVGALVDAPLELTVRRAEEIDEAAAQLAAAVDAHLARVARDVERELERLAEVAPAEPQRPLVLAGVGLGACFVPAVAARLGRVDAAILVGGGASLFEVVLAGTLETDEVQLSLDALTPAQVEFFGDVYLAESRLDPYHTARFLGGRPVVVMQARFDGVIPQWAGDVLYSRLGAPKRLLLLGDHDDLLDELGERGDWLVAWVESELRRARRS